MKRLFTIVALSVSTLISWAYDFEVDGIYYNITSITDFTVETTNSASNPNTYGEGDNSYYRIDGEITIPSTVVYNSITFTVTAIGSGTFKNCSSLKYIHIPNTVTEVGESAFSECSKLQEFIFPNSVKSLGYGCFYNCKKLTKLIFPEGIKTIPDHCCYYCNNLKEITIPSSVVTIESFAFAHGIEYVVCKSNVAPSISADYNKTFKYSTPKYIYIPKGSIDSYKERKWPGEYVEYDNNSLTIYPTFETNGYTFETTKLIDEFEVTIIDFSDKQAIELQIPSNVIYEGFNYIPTEVSSEVFANCTQAETLTIPNNISFLGNNSFSGCSSLKTIISYIKQPMAVQAFSNHQYMFTALKVPSGTIDLYKQTDGWKDFINISEVETLPDNPTVTKCATPVITIVGDKIHFDCDTPEVTFNYEISVPDAQNGIGNDVGLTKTYKIYVFASKEGCLNSDAATKEISISSASGSGIIGDLNGDNVVNAADVVKLVNIISGQ